MPRSTTSRWTSAVERRESGAPSAGGSQATALTSVTSSGGKTARAPGPRFVAQAIEALVGESSSPLADDLRRHVEAGRDLGVRQTLGRQEDDLRALYVTVGERQLCGASFQLRSLFVGESDLDRLGHRSPRFAPGVITPSQIERELMNRST
jgi:hypothetical protein